MLLVTKISGLLSDGSIDMRSTVDTISGGIRDGTKLRLLTVKFITIVNMIDGAFILISQLARADL